MQADVMVVASIQDFIYQFRSGTGQLYFIELPEEGYRMRYVIRTEEKVEGSKDYDDKEDR